MKKPRPRKRFLSPGDERNYLGDWLKYLMAKNTLRTAEGKVVLKRFEQLLQDAGLDDGSILVQEYWSLVHQARDHLALAIIHRERHVELILQAFALGGPVGLIDEDYLAHAMCILVQLYQQFGMSDKASEILARSEHESLRSDASYPRS